MNSQDLYNLQEAYIGVYADLDENYEGGGELADRMRTGHGIKITAKPPSGKKRNPKEPGYGEPSPDGKDPLDTNKAEYRRFEKGLPPTKRTFGRPFGKYAPGKIILNDILKKLPAEDKKKLSREIIRKKTNEEVDIYDIILSLLLDEGYADTYEAAEAIMVNMSEDWRESICEEYDIYEEKKDLPVSRMSKQARRKAFRLGNEINDPESGIGLNVKDDPTAKQLRNMSRVGGKQVKGHIKKGYEQGRLYDPQNAELNWKRNSKG